LITEVDSQRTQDELPEYVKFDAPASTDEVLVAAAKLGDHQAFLALWRRHSSRVLKTTYRITGSREDAEDAIQDAWMKAYLHLNTFDGRAQFATWLTRIAINSSLMILRRKRPALRLLWISATVIPGSIGRPQAPKRRNQHGGFARFGRCRLIQ